MSQDLGRQVKYGVGVESTAGTAAAASVWLNQLSFGLKPKSEYVDNVASFGVIEKSNSATVTRKWAEGTLESKLTAGNGGYLLLGAFGSVATADNADTDASVKDHTFTINQDINGQSLTFVRKDSLSTEAYALGRIGKWEMNMKLDDYVKFNADIMSKQGATTTATPAYNDESTLEFVAKHFSVKTASTVAGLAGATAQGTVQSFNLTVDPNLEADYEAGNVEPYGFSSRGYDLSFEMETRYQDRTFENAYKNGTALAMLVDLKNTDTTIGAAANPELQFTAPRITIDDWDGPEDMDGPVTQTLKGKIHFSPADAYALQAVLTNTVPSYAA